MAYPPEKSLRQAEKNKKINFETHTLIQKCIVHQNTLHRFQRVGIRDRSGREQVPSTNILFCLLRIPACKMKRSHRLGWVRSVGSGHGALCEFAEVKKHATSHDPHCGMEWTGRRYNSGNLRTPNSCLTTYANPNHGILVAPYPNKCWYPFKK